MASVTASRHFDAPPDKVWHLLSDIEHAADRIEAIQRVEILNEGPVGQGTRFKETRIMFGKEATEEMEITEWNPPTHYTLECESCGAHFKSIVSCKPDHDGTLVEMSMDARPMSFMARLMSPLSALMMKSCRKAFEKDLDDIKNAMHGKSDEPATTQPA